MRQPCTATRAIGGRVNRYYDPTTGEFTTIDPLAGGTSNPPQSGPGSGSGSQPVSIYQTVLGAPTSIQFNNGDPAAGLNSSNSGSFSDTTGAVVFPAAFGLPDVALASLSSVNGLAMTTPGPPNPTYIGAGFFSPNSVSSSGSPYAYVGGDPINGVDPGGESGAASLDEAYDTAHHICDSYGSPRCGSQLDHFGRWLSSTGLDIADFLKEVYDNSYEETKDLWELAEAINEGIDSNPEEDEEIAVLILLVIAG